jgi:hypothetical protein
MVAQLTAGAGRKPGLRVRLWGYTDRPVSDAEWKVHLHDAPVDKALFNAVQEHLTSAPIFGDVADDPCDDGRLALLPGEPALVVPPAAVKERRASGATYSFASGKPAGARTAGYRFVPPRLGRRDPYVANRAERLMLEGIGEIADAPPGATHPTAVRVSCRLLTLAASGLLDPLDVGRRVKGVLSSKTHRDITDSEATGILTWAWERVGESHHG